jgi:flagellar assembly protein FliH
MTAPAKFLFDNDFGRADGRRSLAGGDHAALAEAEARGYRTGLATGKAEAAADTERRTADALSRTAASLEALAQGLKAIEGRLEAEAVEVAVAVARKLAPALISREPFAEIAALASESFTHLVGAPHVVVRIDDALYEAARGRLQEIASACGFEGRLVVLAEPEVESGDCRIEWADGGVVRHRAATEAVITEAVERYLAVRRAAVAHAAFAEALSDSIELDRAPDS